MTDPLTATAERSTGDRDAAAALAMAPVVDRSALMTTLTTELGGVLESMEQVTDYLERVVHTVRRHIDGCDEVGLTVLSGDRPHTAAYTTVHTLEIDAVQYALDEGPCLDAARQRTENHAADLVVDDGRWPRFAAQCREEGMRSLLALPLVSGTECVGAINLYAWARTRSTRSTPPSCGSPPPAAPTPSSPSRPSTAPSGSPGSSSRRWPAARSSSRPRASSWRCGACASTRRSRCCARPRRTATSRSGSSPSRSSPG